MGRNRNSHRSAKLREASVSRSLPRHQPALTRIDIRERSESIIFQLKNPVRMVERMEGSQRHWLKFAAIQARGKTPTPYYRQLVSFLPSPEPFPQFRGVDGERQGKP
jgi:hypothetical protein